MTVCLSLTLVVGSNYVYYVDLVVKMLSPEPCSQRGLMGMGKGGLVLPNRGWEVWKFSCIILEMHSFF